MNKEELLEDLNKMNKEIEALKIIDKKNVQVFDLKKTIKLYGKDIEFALKRYNNIYCQLQTNFLTLEEITLLKETLKYD